MVGDSAVADVGGGKAAGLATIWVSRGDAWRDDLPRPDHVAVDAAAAIEILLGTGAG